MEAAARCVQAFPHRGAKRCCWMGRKATVSQPACPGHPLGRAMLMAQELKLNNMRYRKGFVLALTEGCRRFDDARSLKKGMCVRSGEG